MNHNIQTAEDREEERKQIVQGKKFLQDKDLLLNIDNELSKRIVGEEETRKTIFLVSMGGRLVMNACAESSNLMVNDESGAGKDFVVKNTLQIIPKKYLIIRKRISPTVFTYWKNAFHDPGCTWDGMIFYNEDISNNVLNCDVFKVMSSSDGENLSTITINQKPVEILVRGKPVMIITIAVANPKQEILRRYPIINLDVSEIQTKKILKRQAELSILGESPTYDPFIIKSLQLLQRCKVVIPFADLLIGAISTHNIIVRTHFNRLLDYIKYSTAIHQYQRTQDPVGKFIATFEDYDIARMCMLKTTSNQYSVPITKDQKKILEIIEKKPRVKDVDMKEVEAGYSVSDLEANITFIGDRQLRRNLDKLADIGFLKKDKEKRESDKPVIVYKFIDNLELTLPTSEELKSKLENKSTMSNSHLVK